MPDQATGASSVLNVVQAWLPVLTVVGGTLWGLFTYLDHQQQLQDEVSRQASKEAATRRIEAQKPFLEKQLALYFEAAQVTGKLATLKPGSSEWEATENRFWQLYWSELSMVESEAVEAAMVTVGRGLVDFRLKPDDKARRDALNTSIYELAHAIRSAIEAAWKGDQAGN